MVETVDIPGNSPEFDLPTCWTYSLARTISNSRSFLSGLFANISYLECIYYERQRLLPERHKTVFPAVADVTEHYLLLGVVAFGVVAEQHERSWWVAQKEKTCVKLAAVTICEDDQCFVVDKSCIAAASFCSNC